MKQIEGEHEHLGGLRMAGRQRSEDVIINSPMSFAGAAQRAFRLRRITFQPRWLALILTTYLALQITSAWWLLVAVWYLVMLTFGIVTFPFMIPYRILRRGARKRKQEALRHREVLAVLADREAERGQR